MLSVERKSLLWIQTVLEEVLILHGNRKCLSHNITAQLDVDSLLWEMR